MLGWVKFLLPARTRPIVVNRRKIRFIVFISLLLMVSFSATSIISYYVANDSLQRHIRSNTLPLTSDNVYSEIQRDILPTTVISSLMAHDTFVHDWVISGEADDKKIVRYLKSIQERYKTTTAFFISENSRNYYHSSGVLKQVNESDPIDAWYFRVAKMTDDFEINVDNDTANPNRTSVFVNHKVVGDQGEFLGAIGVGLSSASVKKMIELYQARYGRQVYLIDKTGNLKLRSKHHQGADNIRDSEGISRIATQILTSPGGSYSYQKNQQEIYLKTRFVPELNWYLLVEQVNETESQIQNTLWINLTFSFFITLIVILIANLTIGKYQQRLEAMATKDKLTGADNRHAFETIFAQALRIADRRKEALSIAVLDIDNFKAINDQYGHLAGDEVISSVAKILRAKLRDSDMICRWGGEEFLVLLPCCELAAAEVLANKVCQGINEYAIIANGRAIKITASFGLSSYQLGDTQADLFNRADQALYRAKQKGKNRIEVG